MCSSVYRYIGKKTQSSATYSFSFKKKCYYCYHDLLFIIIIILSIDIVKGKVPLKEADE